MNIRPHVLLFIALMTASRAYSDGTNTVNETVPVYYFRTQTNTTFLSRVSTEYTNSTAFLDRFGPSASFDWTWRAQKNGYEYYQNTAKTGRDAFLSSARFSIREATASFIPVDQYRDYWQDVGLHLLHGTIGNTAEQQLSLVSTGPTASEYSWWNDARTDGAIEYGLRPLEGSPYGYFRARIGHCNGQPITIVSGRWYYDIGGNDRMEFQALFPLPHHFEFEAGASFDPFRLNSLDGQSYSSRLQYTGGDTFHIISIGVATRPQETMATLQLSWIPKHW